MLTDLTEACQRCDGYPKPLLPDLVLAPIRELLFSFVLSSEAVKVTAAELYSDSVLELAFIFKLAHPEVHSFIKGKEIGHAPKICKMGF